MEQETLVLSMPLTEEEYVEPRQGSCFFELIIL